MLKIYANTWGNYNENGADGGEWISLPMDSEELENKLDSIAANMGDADPEWFINDYEWDSEIECGEVHEMDSITEWNNLLQEADGLEDYELEEIAAAIEAFSYSFREAMKKQQEGRFCFYSGQSLEDVAAELADELMACHGCKDIPEIFRNYFDYEAFARDLGYDGYTETENGVIYEC